MKIYAIITKDEGSGIPIYETKCICSDKNVVNEAYETEIRQLCDYDPDYPIDESELENYDCICKGAFKIIDACMDSENLITIYCIEFDIKEIK